jgi:Flp pilus assembly protein CpaB
VTLAVTPEQAQLLWLASQEGKLTITLRAFGDDKIADLGTIAEPIRIK